MSAIDFSLPFLVAILSISYPFLLQVISRLDDKYGYDFVALFKKEEEFQWFTLLLKTNIIFNILFILIRIATSYLKLEYKDFILTEVKLLVLISLIVLIFSFFKLIKKMLCYYSTNELVEYLILTKSRKKFESNESDYLKSIKGLAIYSIRQQEQELAYKLAHYYYDLFYNFRKINKSKIVIYPEHYYEHIYALASEFANYTNNKATVLEHYIFSGLLLTGELEYHKISERSYTSLWWIVSISLRIKKDNLVVDFWQNSFSYYRSFVRGIEPIYSSNYREILNDSEIKDREDEEHRFLEFHYALGGHILYRKRYQCLSKIFSYTMSQPPDYVLFPSSTTEIYSWFLEFQEDYRSSINFINTRYSFLELDGLSADYTIRNWISKYLILHLLILYTRHKYYIFQDFNNVPTLPDSISKQKFWLEYVDYFGKLLDEILEDKILLKILRVDFITDEWCKSNNKMTPREIVDTLKMKLIESIDNKEKTQEVNPIKKIQFNEYNKNVIRHTINEYSNVINTQLIEENFYHWSNAGFTAVFEKSGFCIDQGVDYSNITSFLGEQYSRMFKLAFSDILFQKKTITYSLKDNEIIEGLQKLKLNHEKHLVIAFDLSYLLDSWVDNGILSKNGEIYSYHNVKINHFKVCNYQLVGRSLFIMCKSDLPSVVFKDLESETKEKYKLSSIDDSIHLYGNIIDLFQNEELRDELKPSNPDKDLNKCVLAYLGIYTEFRLKQNIKIVQLKQYIDYKGKGLPNSLTDIEVFDSINKDYQLLPE